jgi:hypothetical protein
LSDLECESLGDGVAGLMFFDRLALDGGQFEKCESA